MAQMRDLAKLFAAIGAADLPAAASMARRIADAESAMGRHSAAQLLRGSLSQHIARQVTHSVVAVPANLIREPDGPPLSQVSLRSASRAVLREVLLEFRHADLLAQSAVPRRRSLLLWGPPGCGKTLTARAIGLELGLPVFTARLSAIIGSYLGQTGSNLRELFQYAQQVPCILLLDELDALGRSRGQRDDVAEIDRVVISLLQELDHSAPAGLVIGATNLASSLDRALWRRFEVTLSLPAPTRKELAAFARDRLQFLDYEPHAPLNLGSSKTYADVERVIANSRREAVLRRIEH